MKHRVVSAMLVLALAVSLLAACSGASDSSAPAGDASSSPAAPSAAASSDAAAPVEAAGEYDNGTITFTLDNFMPEIPPSDSASMQFLREITGTDIQINWVPNIDYMVKLNTMIASGDTTDVIMNTTLKDPNIIYASRNDVFWELTDYIEQGDFPRLQTINTIVRDNLRIDGKDFALPRNIELPHQGVTYRSDWQEKLNLEDPTMLTDLAGVISLDTLANWIRAFTFEDPDGNGVDDSYGLVMFGADKIINAPWQIQLFMGGPNLWDVSPEGKFTPYFLHETWIPALDWLRGLYAEGCINPDFATITGQQQKDLIDASKGGVSIAHVAQLTERVPVLQSVDPSYDMNFVLIDNGNGVRIFPSDGANGMYMMPKSSVENEEELGRVLRFFDRLADPEVQTFMQWGLKGVHCDYNAEGVLETIDMDGYIAEVNILRRLKPFTILEAEQGVAAPEMQKRNHFYNDLEEYCIGNPALAYISETNLQLGEELEVSIKDSWMQYVMGAIDQATLESVNQQWLDNGGAKIIEEYEAAYAAANA